MSDSQNCYVAWKRPIYPQTQKYNKYHMVLFIWNSTIDWSDQWWFPGEGLTRKGHGKHFLGWWQYSASWYATTNIECFRLEHFIMCKLHLNKTLCCEPGTKLCALHTLCCLTCQQSHEVDLIFSALQLRKPRLRRFKQPASGHTAKKIRLELRQYDSKAHASKIPSPPSTHLP